MVKIKSESNFLGIDIGGTSIKYGIVDSTGSVIFEGSLFTQADLGVKAFGDKLYEIVEKTEEFKPVGIGVSVAGIVNPVLNRVTSGAVNLSFLHDFDIAEHLSSKTNLPVKLINDVRAAALGEMWTGAAKEIDTFFCCTIGTGLGGSLVINRQIYEGSHNRAGEIGFMAYENDKEFLENKVSSKALLIRAQKALDYPYHGLEQFFDQLKEGNQEYYNLFSDWLNPLCRGLADVLIMVDPQALVIGGGITETGDFFRKEIKERLSEFLPTKFYNQTQILLAENGNLAGVIGAVKNLEFD